MTLKNKFNINYEPYHSLCQVVHKFEERFAAEKMYYTPNHTYGEDRVSGRQTKFRAFFLGDAPIIMGVNRTWAGANYSPIKTGYLFARSVPWHEWTRSSEHLLPDTREEGGSFITIGSANLSEDDRRTFMLDYSLVLVNPFGRIAVMHASEYGKSRIDTKSIAKSSIRRYQDYDFTVRPTQSQPAQKNLYDDATLEDIYLYVLRTIQKSVERQGEQRRVATG